jgi:hypothetical protein
MLDLEEFIERLKDCGWVARNDAQHTRIPMLYNAIMTDHLAALEVAVKEKDEIIDCYEAMKEGVEIRISDLNKKIDKLTTENELLKKVVEKLLDWNRKYPQTEPYVTELDHVIKLAQNAIIEEQQEFEDAIWKESGYKPVWRKDEKDE